MAEIVRRRSCGGVLPLGRHASIRGSSFLHSASSSITPPSQEEQNARKRNTFKAEQAVVARGISQTLSASVPIGACPNGIFQTAQNALSRKRPDTIGEFA